jgi:hypothetical protein
VLLRDPQYHKRHRRREGNRPRGAAYLRQCVVLCRAVELTDLSLHFEMYPLHGAGCTYFKQTAFTPASCTTVRFTSATAGTCLSEIQGLLTKKAVQLSPYRLYQWFYRAIYKTKSRALSCAYFTLSTMRSMRRDFRLRRECLASSSPHS